MLVIIGLIVGGVLVGADLIRVAKFRQQVSQIEKYNTGVNAFRLKYSFLPGDIPSGIAVQYGFTARIGNQGQGDGNGLIECGAASWPYFGGECLLFWRDLTDAGYSDGGFRTSTGATGISVSSSNLDLYLPRTKLGYNVVYPFGLQGKNAYELMGLSSVTAGAFDMVAAYIPADAKALDEKMDDGQPLTGAVQARGVGNQVDLAASTTSSLGGAACVYTGASSTDYNIQQTSLQCVLRIDMQ